VIEREPAFRPAEKKKQIIDGISTLYCDLGMCTPCVSLSGEQWLVSYWAGAYPHHPVERHNLMYAVRDETRARKRYSTLLASVLTLMSYLTGCASDHAPHAALREVPADATLQMTPGDTRVGTYVSSPWGFSTNTFWIEGPEGLILIDTQFLPSETEEAVRWAEQATGKKIRAAIVLHPNPDKFNGTLTLQNRGIRVITSDQVLSLIPKVHEKRVRSFYERYKPDYPTQVPKPDSFGDHTTDLRLAGVSLRLYVLGPGCSDAHVAVLFDGHLFVGDLVASGVHSWLELGNIEEWIQRLHELKAMHPRYVHPGRGSSGGVELLGAEEFYLSRVLATVQSESRGVEVNESVLQRAKSRIVDQFPGYRFDVFLDVGIETLMQRLRHPKTDPTSVRMQ